MPRLTKDHILNVKSQDRYLSKIELHWSFTYTEQIQAVYVEMARDDQKHDLKGSRIGVDRREEHFTMFWKEFHYH